MKLILNHLTPAKKHNRIFWHPSLPFLCFAEHRSCGLVSQKEWTDFCCTHSRATSDLKNRSAGVSYEPCTINLHGIVNQTCTIAHFPCPSTTTYVYSPLPLSKFTSPFLEFVVCRFDVASFFCDDLVILPHSCLVCLWHPVKSTS